MTSVDLKKIMEMKQIAMKRCEERIRDAAKQPPCQKKLDEMEKFGVTLSLKRKHGL
ncbi:MAG: hypothetical protein GXY48_06605 [Methanomicrobiales archaeon]|nr:hypothetical protein [Methanomicrobiales archaeon]